MQVENNKFLTTKEAAALLRISLPTLYRYIDADLLPYYRIKGIILFDKDELIQWIKSHRIEPKEETINKTVQSLGLN
jgi:excisionase family DNA binding protein